MDDKIYVVVTQTGTILSRILKRLTHAEYNHVSVSVDPTLNLIYSFGRKNPYNAFFGGFVKESPKFGTFKRFSETEAIVFTLDVSPETKDAMERKLADMYEHRKEYRYDTAGLLLAPFNVRLNREKTYYCSSFVQYILMKFGLTDDAPFSKNPKPIEFLNIKGARVIYKGKLRLYEEFAGKQ